MKATLFAVGCMPLLDGAPRPNEAAELFLFTKQHTHRREIANAICGAENCPELGHDQHRHEERRGDDDSEARQCNIIRALEPEAEHPDEGHQDGRRNQVKGNY